MNGNDSYFQTRRRNVVDKYKVVRTSLIDNGTTPLQVGNGNFAFGVDNTGMQVRKSNIRIGTFVYMLTLFLDISPLQYPIELAMA